MTTGAPTSARERANAAQREAADPQVSAFVSASAGSGKTKLLTDRLLRLMLAGADPARIQCLTYTTAAAAEMALRLRKELGKWATSDDAMVDASLRGLGVAPTGQSRERARALFARVLDLPGGMRVETIHAFCQSLLRRFPLEASVSPHFRLLGDADTHAAMLAAQETVLANADPTAANREEPRLARLAAIKAVASVTDLRNFFSLARLLGDDRERLAVLRQAPPGAIASAQRTALAVPSGADAAVAAAVAWPEETAVVAALRVIAEQGPPARTAPDAARRLAWLSQPEAGRRADWPAYESSWLSGEREPLTLATLVGQKLERRRPDVAVVIGEEVGRVLEVLETRRASSTASLSAALLDLGLPVSEAYRTNKERRARLDYGDLIEGTFRLLQEPGAAWVLHKLDGGLDHLLLDEVQDTSPAQWQIAGKLVAEFFAGQGARDSRRTVFAVGDRKQSIFSFQGAEPDGFDTWRQRLRRLAQDSGQGWRDVQLDVSFRSTVPVLALVDAVFADPVAARGVAEQPLHHESDRAGQAGSVTLWPLEKRSEKTHPPVWDAPLRRERAKGASQRLAEHVADWVARNCGATDLPSRGRRVSPGDILVLVRRRDDLARAVVRALKHRGIPVAGLDRMILTEQPAVADLLALGDALLLPRDDLAVACVLTSPLGGLSDDDLILLAPGRTGSLWDELRRRAGERPRWEAAWDYLSALFARVDFDTPHALLVEALGPLGGRARLLARLGPEAAEPIDELLAAALAYGAEYPPSLQGFLHWLRRSAAQVKRQPEAAGSLVRLMTVHGAKGLQAPIVILPDTTAMPKERDALLWTEADGLPVPIWAFGDEGRGRRVRALRAEAAARAAEEHNRLLYVALTRAEDWLIVCGAEPRSSALPDACWYRLIERGFSALPCEQPEAPGGGVLHHSCSQEALPDRPDGAGVTAGGPVMPAWAGAAPDWRPTKLPPISAGLARIAPSRPRDADLGPPPPANSPLTSGRSRFERGRVVHTLLQHLPELPPADRRVAAERFLSREPGVADRESTLAEVMAVLDAPELAAAFGPGSRPEVPLTGVIDAQVVAGLVDRLAVLADRVIIIDYKTNRWPPDTVEQTPVLYLRQMAAYRAVLAALYPDRPVQCALVWTSVARVTLLPPGLLDGHAPAGSHAPMAIQTAPPRSSS